VRSQRTIFNYLKTYHSPNPPPSLKSFSPSPQLS
jgi:hypothetical protein